MKQLYATKKQVSAFKTLISKLGIDEETEDRMIASYGVDSCKKLNVYQISELIKKLSSECPNNPPKKKTAATGKGERGKMNHLTQAQADRIMILQKLLGWHPAGLGSFIHRQTQKLKGVEMLMNFEAKDVIVGMQRVYSDGNKNKYLELNAMSNSQLEQLFKQNGGRNDKIQP